MSAGLALPFPEQLVDVIAERVAERLAGRAPATGPEPWIGVAEAARHLDCEPKRIYDLKSQRRIPFRKDGSRVLFRRSDLDAYLEASS